MAQKIKKWKEWLSLSGETAKVISYADYFARRPLFTSLQIKNASDEFVTGLTLTISADNGMLIPFEKSFEEIPFESVIKVELGNILSPFYFSSSEEVKEERMDQIMRRQLEISLENNRDLVGFTLEVIIDEEDEDGSYIGRSRYDAPEIDNSVLINTSKKHVPGDIINVRIGDACDYDLVGEEV